MNQTKLAKLKQYIETADLALQQAREVLSELGGDKIADKEAAAQAKGLTTINDANSRLKIIEGVFNGQNMVGPDGKEYSIPVNYASKSKLVVGDVLKLTIQEDGSFIYKQIKPAERERLTGEIVKDEVEERYCVLISDGRKFNVLTASITYFKGEVGDKAIVLIPKDRLAEWAAVENVIKKSEEHYEKNPATVLSRPEPKPDLIEWPNEKSTSAISEDHEMETKPLPQESPALNTPNVSYNGITQYVKHEPIFAEHIEESKSEEGKDKQKTEEEKRKIEELINNEKTDADDDLGLEDWEDI